MRHRFHALCPYFAMFPEHFVEKHLVYSRPGDVVLDPFSGRGTTPFQSLLQGRVALASDLSPVAYCVSKAKVSGLEKAEVAARLSELEEAYNAPTEGIPDDGFFRACFHETTLRQVVYLRTHLQWQADPVDCFIAALCLGLLHGESHKSPKYFSNRMPRTIATKPAYSVRWWESNGYRAPERDVFSILLRELDFRFETGAVMGEASVALADARDAARCFADHHGDVGLVITSPPYPDTTHFVEDQWLRNWFLGGEPTSRGLKRGDDRHTSLDSYWGFLEESWKGLAPLLRQDNATIVVRIGGAKLDLESAKAGLKAGIEAGTERDVEIASALQSDIVGGQLKSFRPSAAGTKREFDFVFRLRAA